MLLYTVVRIALHGKDGAFSYFYNHRNCVWMLHLSGWKEWWDAQGVWAERSMPLEREFPRGDLAPATAAIPSERNNQPRFTITQLKAKPPGIFQTTSGRGVCTTSKRRGGRQPRATGGQTSLPRSALPRSSFGQAAPASWAVTQSAPSCGHCSGVLPLPAPSSSSSRLPGLPTHR